jgi:hypothetical protein
MFLLSENSKRILNEAVLIDTKGVSNNRKFLNEAFSTIYSELSEDYYNFEKRCEWFVNKLIPGYDSKTIEKLKNLFKDDIEIQVNPFKISLKDKKGMVEKGSMIELEDMSKIYFTAFLSIFCSVNEQFRDVQYDLTGELISKQSELMEREFIRLSLLYRHVYKISPVVAETLHEILTTNEDLPKFSILISSLAMILLLDIDFCSSNAVLLLILARSTRCSILSAKKYITIFVQIGGQFIGADTDYLAKDIYDQIAKSTKE